MDNQDCMRNDVYKLYFMHNKISIPYTLMDYWLTIPAFTNTMLDLVDKNEIVDNHVVYDYIKKIDDKRLARRNGMSRRAIKNTLKYLESTLSEDKNI